MPRRFMIYIGSDRDGSGRFCPGSRECVGLIRASSSLSRMTRIENVDIIRRENIPIPPWLDGTPILVDTVLKLILRGTVARDYLDSISLDTLKEHGVGVEPARVYSAIPEVHSDVSAPPVPVRRHEQSRSDVSSVGTGAVQAARISEEDVAKHMQERDALTAQMMQMHRPPIGGVAV